MDHTINQLKSRMNNELDFLKDFELKREDIQDEIKAYVDAINIFEQYYYGEKRTNLETVLAYYD